MADEFPTLEAAAALGVLALSLRAFLLARQSSAIRRDNAELAAALRAGQHARAIELCARTESPAYSDVARRVLGVVEDRAHHVEAGRFKEQLAHAAHAGLANQRRRLQTGRARDLIALAVLFGALAYGLGGGLGDGSWFLLLVFLACCILVASFLLRGKLARDLRKAVEELLVAAAGAAATAPDALSDRRCRNCGRAEQIVVRDAQALGPAPWGVSLLWVRICRNCGELHGKVRDPAAIPIGPSHGTALAVTLDPGGLEIASNPREHEG